MKRNVLILSGIGLMLLVVAGHSRSPSVIKAERPLMGTMAIITIVDPDKQLAQEAIRAAFAEIARIENQISTFQPASDAAKLNRDKQISHPSEELRLIIQKAVEYGQISGGAFDITVQPILDLYKVSFSENNRPPTEEQIRAVLPQVDYRKIKIRDSLISIGPDQKITLGALGHGYAVDRVIAVLKKKGIRQALVDLGGEIRVIGTRAKNKSWTVAVENPRKRDDYIAVLSLPSDKAVATSGDYEDFYDREKKFHHIIDPTTGYSATELSSVTIITDSVLVANAIAVAVFVLGKDKGLKFIAAQGNAEGLLVTRDGKIWKSPGFAKFLAPSRVGGCPLCDSIPSL